MAGLVLPLAFAGAVLVGASPADASPLLLVRPNAAAAAAVDGAEPAGDGAVTTSTTDPLSGSPIVGSPLDALASTDTDLEGSGLRDGGIDDPKVAARVADVLRGLAPDTDRISNSRTKGN